MTIDNNLRRKFVKHVYKKLKERLSGSGCDRVYGDKPQIKFFVGSLCSQDPKSSLGSIRTKVAPVRMGVEFLLNKDDVANATLKIKPKASVFFKVIPDYEEQLEAAVKKSKLSREEFIKEVEKQKKLSEEGKEDINLGIKPLTVFKKHKIKDVLLSCKISEVVEKDFEGEFELPGVKELVEDAHNAYKSEERLYRPKKRKKDEMESKIPLSVLSSEEDYYKFMSEWGEKDVYPSWDFKIVVKTTEFNDSQIKVSVLFENTCVAKENDHIDNFLFDTHLDVEVEGANIQNFIIDYLNDHYKYNGDMGASGINCEAKRTGNKIVTEHMPFFEQLRLKTNDKLKAKFEDLASDRAVEVLEKIAKEMRRYLEEEYKRFGKEAVFKSDIGKKRFEEDMNAFEDEIKRFEYGIEILKKYPLAMKAFKKMNLSFLNSSKSKASDKKYDSWRIFQIIFIVMNVPDVVSIEYPEVKSNFERVEVLYFPTGGGKTETYLGLAIFTLFFDRLRGKKFGVSVMTKFPLRLLSLQQIQRIANILAQAELIRREDPETNSEGSEEFSLGYFVGDRNTPNKLMSKGTIFGGQDKDLLTPIVTERNQILKGELKLDDENLEGRKYLIISKCPFCGSKEIMIDADVEKIRLMHRCMNKECQEDVLPIYVSDMEIYRYLPSFIISTLDKIAICGLQKNFRNLFGQVTHKCPLHGYSNSSECTEKWLCKADKEKFEKITPYDPVPTLQIQDEMHLVRESLGTFNSHYESFLEHYEKMLTKGKRSMKILTATATISEYKMQTDHLYAKDACQYPSQGPKISESFYASVDNDDLNRLIIGITPHFKTMIFSVLDVIETYHELIQRWHSKPQELIAELGVEVTNEEIKEMLKDYMIKLSYHLAKSDGDSISNSIRTMTNRSLREKGIPEIKQSPLTGDVSFNDVRIVLDKIENPKTEEDMIDLIIATSMISHGVDIDALNFMVFMGMPHNTAEYIQASSRVGRKYPGIAIVIFNPTRERDQSYFKFFTKFHEYKDLLVEAVPINRWAKFSINRTVPGIFSASVLNYFDAIASPQLKGKSLNMSKVFEKAIDEGIINEEEIKQFLLESYKVNKDTIGFGFDKVIEDKTETYIHEITQTLGNEFITRPMSDKPMTSLRDVDTLIDINLSPDGMMILKNIKASRTPVFDEEENEEDE
ncbi:MAG: hypothetical protein D6734_10880 [Candidatus Schekmanbacteria bacterium]|nr:MAG: hypothetical protein D6734_10880 [Candidatus Schekmanbacteria bacterium]